MHRLLSTADNTLTRYKGALSLDDVMSHNELTTMHTNWHQIPVFLAGTTEKKNPNLYYLSTVWTQVRISDQRLKGLTGS